MARDLAREKAFGRQPERDVKPQNNYSEQDFRLSFFFLSELHKATKIITRVLKAC